MKSKYKGDIVALNKAWGTYRWSLDYKTFDEIKENEFSLAINRYVGHEIVNEDLEPADVMAAEWANHLETLHQAMQAVSSALEVNTYE